MLRPNGLTRLATLRMAGAMTLAVLIAVGFVIGSRGAAGVEPVRGTSHAGVRAADESYRVEQNMPCFEPDVFNLTERTQVFAVQLQVGTEYSEVQVVQIEPNGAAHLHLFDAVWTLGPERDRLIEKADDMGCALLVFAES